VHDSNVLIEPLRYRPELRLSDLATRSGRYP